MEWQRVRHDCASKQHWKFYSVQSDKEKKLQESNFVIQLEDLNLLLFADDMMQYIQNLKMPLKLLKLSEFSKILRYKMVIQKSLVSIQ